MTPEEKKQYLKEYYLKNKDKRKAYLEKNKDKIKESADKRAKDYYEKNKKLVNEKNKNYHEENKDKISDYQKTYRKTNSEKNKDYLKKYYKNNKQKLLAKQKIYQDNNKAKRNARTAIRKQTDLLFRLTTNTRSYISTIVSGKKLVKKTKLTEILGCTVEQYLQHIESNFLPWMTWDNYGKYNGSEGYGWDIDHLIPLSSAKSYDELIALFKYTNTQPLCSYINRNIKKDSISF